MVSSPFSERFGMALRCIAGMMLLVFSGVVETSAQAPTPGRGSSRPRPEDKQQAPDLHSVPVFEFHSGFWLNLHHFLYQQARRVRPGLRQPADSATQATPPSEPGERGGAQKPAALTSEEERAWASSVGYYTSQLADRDLLFNGDMVAIKNRLAEIEAEPDLRQSGLRPELVVALERAAPIYRANWWPGHDRANRNWVAAVTPWVTRTGGTLAEKLAAVYQASWPTGRIRVDVSFYANWAGAYTTLDPLHITLSSSDPRNQGPAALEVLFHEASHALADAVRQAIARECRTRNKPIPRDLWHALVFYTTGEIVRRALGSPEGRAHAQAGAAGSPESDYLPYAQRHGLYARGWQNYLRLLERYWQPYLDGSVEFDRAVARLVAAL